MSTEQSTSLNNLPGGNIQNFQSPSNNNEQVVENILNELNNMENGAPMPGSNAISPGNPNAMAQLSSATMSGMPGASPLTYNPNVFDNNGQPISSGQPDFGQPGISVGNYQQPQMPLQSSLQVPSQQDIYYQPNIPQNFSQDLSSNIFESIVQELKEPSIVSLITFVISFRITDELIENQLQFKSEFSKQFIKAIFAGVLFWLIKKFFLKM